MLLKAYSVSKNNSPHTSRITTAVIALALCALSAQIFTPVALLFFPEKMHIGSSSHGDVRPYEHEFAMVRRSLPSHGIVGYLSNYPADDYTRRFYAAQYALAPLIVVDSIKHKFVVGDFCRNDVNLEIYKKNGLSLLRDFGNGIMVFERKSE